VRAAHLPSTPTCVALATGFFLLVGCGAQQSKPPSPGEKLDKLLREGKLAEAEKYCRGLVRKSDNKQVHTHRGNLAHVLCLRGEEALAESGFFDPDPAKAVKAKGTRKYREAHAFFKSATSEARQVFTRLPTKKWSAFAKVRATLGLALYRQGLVEEALVELKRALADDDRLGSAHNTLGLIYHEQGNEAAAVANFKAALKAQPGLGEAAYNLGVYFEDELSEMTKLESDALKAGGRPPKGTRERKAAAREEAIKYYKWFLKGRTGDQQRKKTVRRRIDRLKGKA
jgi:tetratricopeptide (TPR) repeat protein